jgi:hypothetical protein
MALYAFDGTWNSDEDKLVEQTNVVRFTELYVGNNTEYVTGVGTRFGKLGHVLGGLFGSGGHTRIDEMYDELCDNWKQGDHIIDIIGFSRGAALAVHFANKIGKQGIKLDDDSFEKCRIRFLGVWDIVGSFGLSFDTFINFQDIDLGWDLDTVHSCVDNCYHAMALDERRETFMVKRVDPDNEHSNIHEVWFRGVHSDIGGGNGNVTRSNIVLQWMLEQGRSCGLTFNETKAKLPRYSEVNRFAVISENTDLKLDPRRVVGAGDSVHPSAQPIELAVGESHQCEVLAKPKYNWTAVRLVAGASYTYSVDDGDTWSDASIDCGPDGWISDDLPWYKEGVVQFMERYRRLPDANWFALVGAYGDEDGKEGNNLFLIGNSKKAIVAKQDADLYLFANDMPSKYDNNDGSLMVTITRTA